MANKAIDLSAVSKAVETALKNDTSTKDYTIGRSVTVNEEPADAVGGWVGIYRNALTYEPRTLGSGGGNYRGTAIVFLVAQITSLDSGADAEEGLEGVVGNIINVLMNDPVLRQTILMVKGIDVTYTYERTKESSAYFQQAIIKVTCDTHT